MSESIHIDPQVELQIRRLAEAIGDSNNSPERSSYRVMVMMNEFRDTEPIVHDPDELCICPPGTEPIKIGDVLVCKKHGN